MEHAAINSGELNRLVTVNQLLSSADTFGGQSDSLSSIKQVWACIKSLSGSEQIQASQVTGFVTHEITTRYDSAFTFSGLTPAGSRIVITYDSRRFYVDSVHDVDDAHVKMIWNCVEVRN